MNHFDEHLQLISSVYVVDLGQPLVWTGSEVAFISTGQEAYLGFVLPDGSNLHRGPTIEFSRARYPALQSTPTGYALAYTGIASSPVLAELDHDGAVVASKTGMRDDITHALVVQRGERIAAWRRGGSGGADQPTIGPPWSGVAYAPEMTRAYDMAGDGSRVIALSAAGASAYEDGTITPVPLPAGTALSVGWTGAEWSIGLVSDRQIYEVRLDGNLAMISSSPIFTLPINTVLLSLHETVDARRALFSIYYRNWGSAGSWSELVQTCFP